MEIFKITGDSKLELVNNSKFESEKQIQTLVEKNLQTLFDLTFVKSEVVCEQFRFDTLCWDE